MAVARDPFVSGLQARLRGPLPGGDAHARFSPRPPRRGPFSRDIPADARPAAALILLYPHRGPEGPRLRGDADPVATVTDRVATVTDRVATVTDRVATVADRVATVAGDLQVPGWTALDTSWHIPLTVRRADLPDHAGQISLPGGRIDPGETPEATALREAAEEVGVDPAAVTVLGSLSPLYVLVSRFVVTPVVAVAAERPHFRPAEREVAELIEAPLASLRDPATLVWGHRTREGYLVDFPYFDLAGHQVWGATAMMLGEFLSLIDPDFGPPPMPERSGT